MKSNVMTVDKEMVSLNASLYGLNRIKYRPLALSIAGNTKTYDNGVKEKSHKVITWDVAQKFPSDQLAEIMKPTMSELPQVHFLPSEFTYNQYAKTVEAKISAAFGGDVTNGQAGALQELWKEWDSLVMKGEGFNEGFIGHSKATIKAASALSFATLTSEAIEALGNIKSMSGITSDELGRVLFVHDSKITAMLDKYESGSELTNREKFEKQFPGMVLVEAPQAVFASAGTGKFLMVLREMVTIHHASLPAVYAVATGKYGLDADTLYTYESVGVELEQEGAIQEVNFA